MATESPLLHDGSQNVAAADYRRSSITGATLFGQNGSGQFLAVRQSTTTDRTVAITTASGQKVYGILQNAPAVGDAADVGIFGITKAMSGSSSITPGLPLMATSSGALIPCTTGAQACGAAIEAAAAVGQIFSMALYGFGGGPLAP